MDEAYRQTYYDLERNHWWFKAREEILKSYLKANLKTKDLQSLKILNLGAATGRSSQILMAFGEVDSVEPDEGNCEFLWNSLNLPTYQASATSLPFAADTYDLVCAFDVIEHIHDDDAAIQEIKRVLKPNGSVLITVPAFNFLWSRHDKVNQHYRRYTKKGLTRLITPYLTLVYCSYFNFFLFPIIALKRLLSEESLYKTIENSSSSDFECKFPVFVETFLYKIFRSERHLIKHKFFLPAGISIIFRAKLKS